MKKKWLVVLVVLMSTFVLTACGLFSAKEKTFTKIGLSVTLNDSFAEKEDINSQMRLESRKFVFLANREEKALMPNITSLELENSNYFYTAEFINFKKDFESNKEQLPWAKSI